jgi:predicted Zn finger-like uncharacterized protein
MAVRSVLTFSCPSCARTFQVPESVIPPEGARGRCKGCGTSLTVFQDGHSEPVGAPTAAHDPSPASAPPVYAPAPAGPDPKLARIWYLRLQDPKDLISPGPHCLEDLGQMISREEIVEEDQARLEGGAWMPMRAYPVFEAYWTERNLAHREKHGDEEHCAVHRDREPGWMCIKCKNFLCQDCVVNKPVIEGGAPRWVCDACDFDTKTLTKKSAFAKSIPGMFKKS